MFVLVGEIESLDPDRDIPISPVERVLDFIGWNDLVLGEELDRRVMKEIIRAVLVLAIAHVRDGRGPDAIGPALPSRNGAARIDEVLAFPLTQA